MKYIKITLTHDALTSEMEIILFCSNQHDQYQYLIIIIMPKRIFTFATTDWIKWLISHWFLILMLMALKMNWVRITKLYGNEHLMRWYYDKLQFSYCQLEYELSSRFLYFQTVAIKFIIWQTNPLNKILF